MDPIDGVREINGIKTYEVKYICQCGDMGKRYANDDSYVINCHKCKRELLISKLAKDDLRGIYRIAY